MASPSPKPSCPCALRRRVNSWNIRFLFFFTDSATGITDAEVQLSVFQCCTERDTSFLCKF